MPTVLITGPTVTQNLSRHFVYPQMDGQAEFAWPNMMLITSVEGGEKWLG